MEVRRIAWLGVRTERADAMVAFMKDVLGLPLENAGEGQWVFSLPDGAKTEVFSSDSPYNSHFEDGPPAWRSSMARSSPKTATQHGSTSERRTATSTS